MTITRLLSSALGAFLVSAFISGMAQAEIQTRYVDYSHGDVPLSGYLAYDNAVQGQRPGVLVVHARSGMNEKALEDARMFARMGYVAFAADIYGKGVVPQTVPEMQELSGIYGADRPLTRTRAQAGLDTLAEMAMVDASKIAVIGYCFGGMVAVELAESGASLVGVVPVHGSFRNFTSADANNIQGSVLILHGARDETAPMEEVNKLIADLDAAEVDWQLELYSGAEHGFTNPGSPAEERADREYKAAAERFFEVVFGG